MKNFPTESRRDYKDIAKHRISIREDKEIKMDFRLDVLKKEDIEKIDAASRTLLSSVGIRVPDERIKALLKKEGARIKEDVVFFTQEMMDRTLDMPYKGHTFFGRDLSKKAVLDKGHHCFQSTSGQFAILEMEKGSRRAPTTQDLIDGVRLGDGLENIDIVGAFVMPVDIKAKDRSVLSAYHLLKNTGKPVTLWIDNEESAKKIIRMMQLIRGGAQKLAEKPLTYAFIETISPLAYTRDSLGILWQFTQAGLPVGLGPMAMTCASAPGTLAATITLENAEILSGVIIARMINKDIPLCYWGIPHVMDMKTASISFGSPEQTLMALAAVQLAAHYHLAVGTNTGLSDALLPDAQSGTERGISAASALMAGCNIFGHQGICGSDQGASLEQLYIDNEVISYIKRIKRGLCFEDSKVLLEEIQEKGIGGSFLTADSTLEYYKKELWMPELFYRGSFESFQSSGFSIIKAAKEGAAKKIQEFDRQKHAFSEKIEQEICKIIKE